MSGDLEGLDRVLTRLALTDDDRLEGVLPRLFPAVLGKLGTEDDRVRKRALEILSHVNKRARALPSLRFPLPELVSLYADPATEPKVAAFAAAYVEQAAARVPPIVCLQQSGRLLAALEGRPIAHADPVLRVVARGWQGLAVESSGERGLSEAEAVPLATAALPAAGSHVRTAWVDRALRLLLLQTGAASGPPPTSPVDPLPASPPPPGLSFRDIAALRGAAPLPAADLRERKLGLLHLTRLAELPPSEAFALYVTAADDPDMAVSALGEVLLKKRCSVVGAHPAIDLEGDLVVEPLFAMCIGEGRWRLGGAEGGASAPALPGTGWIRERSPAPVATRVRVLGLACRSQRAASLLPTSLDFAKAALASPAPRERRAAMELVAWIAKQAPSAALRPHAEEALEVAKGALGLSDLGLSAPTPAWAAGDASAREQRATALHVVACLAGAVPGVVAGAAGLPLVEGLFGLLATEPPGARAAVQEALASLSSAFREAWGAGRRLGAEGESTAADRTSGFATPQLRPLLELNLAAPDPGTRSAALRWANDLFPFSDAWARVRCLEACGDPVASVAAAGRDGLRAQRFATGALAAAEGEGASERAALGGGARARTPLLRDVLEELASRHSGLRGIGGPAASLPADLAVCQAAVDFLGELWRLESKPGLAAPGVATRDALLTLLLSVCSPRGAGSALQVAALETALLVEEDARVEGPDLMGAHAGGDAAEIARADGIPEDEPGAVEGGEGPPRRLRRRVEVPEAPSTRVLGRALSALPFPAPGLVDACGSSSRRVRELATAVLASCGAAAGAAEATAVAEGAAVRLRGPDRPGWAPDAGPGGAALLAALAAARGPGDSVTALALEVLGEVATREPLGRREAAAAAGYGLLAARLAGPQEVLDASRTAGVVTAATRALSSADVQAAIDGARALGFLGASEAAAGTTPVDGAAHGVERAVPDGAGAILTALFARADDKRDEVAAAVAEAGVWALGDVAASPLDVATCDFPSLTSRAAILAGRLERAGRGQAGGTASASGGAAEVPYASRAVVAEATPAAPWLLARQRAAVAELLVQLPSTRKERRQAAATWLALLLEHGRSCQALRGASAELAPALALALGDPVELVADAAARALRALHARGGEEERARLVRALTAVLTRKAGVRGVVDELEKADQGGEEAPEDGGASGERGSGSSSAAGPSAAPAPPPAGADGRDGGRLLAWRELAYVAAEAGRPDALFDLLELARDADATSRRGPGLGLLAGAGGREGPGGGTDGGGGDISGAKARLRPLAARLLPRLLRASHARDERVAGSCATALAELIGDRRRAVAEGLPTILPGLLADAGGRGLEARASAARALAECVRGQEASALEPYLARLWVMVLRLADDVSAPVRKAGLELLAVLRGVTLRFADPGATAREDAAAALRVVLPVLVDKGLPSPATEIKAVSLEVVTSCLRAADPTMARPLVPSLLPPLLDALSGMEDVRLNYLEQHAEAYGVDEGMLGRVRVAVAAQGPAGAALGVLASATDGPTLRACVPALRAAARGPGVATRAGAAKWAAQVLRRLRQDAADAAPLCWRTFADAARAERASEPRRAAADAAGTAAAAAGRERAAKVARAAARKYEAEGAGEEERLVEALLLKAVAAEAPDAAGDADDEVAPIAFVARFDVAEAVAGPWEDVWEGAVSRGGGGARSRGEEIAAAAGRALEAAAWHRKRAGARAAAALARQASGACARAAPGLLTKLSVELGGAAWDGKEELAAATGEVASAAAAEGQPGSPREPLEGALTALSRAAVKGGPPGSAAAALSHAASEALVLALEALDRGAPGALAGHTPAAGSTWDPWATLEEAALARAASAEGASKAGGETDEGHGADRRARRALPSPLADSAVVLAAGARSWPAIGRALAALAAQSARVDAPADSVAVFVAAKTVLDRDSGGRGAGGSAGADAPGGSAPAGSVALLAAAAAALARDAKAASTRAPAVAFLESALPGSAGWGPGERRVVEEALGEAAGRERDVALRERLSALRAEPHSKGGGISTTPL